MDSIELARSVRLTALDLCHSKRASHIGGAYSVADILAVLYADVLNISPLTVDNPERDRVFYSKGHACTALYAVLNACGYLKGYDLLKEFTVNGSYFTSHVNHQIPGVELSTGSLGHALGVACGTALALKRKGNAGSVFTIVSDGELDEGSNWESLLAGAHHALDNMILIIDYNKIQSFGSVEEVLALEPLADKLRAFRWQVTEVDGHNHDELRKTLAESSLARNGLPKAIIAHTVKGKGVSFMEGQLAWHYKSPNDADYTRARAELEA
ncbi:transketolase [Niveibacterium sp. 24ML]|uniref:transketolase n=1 Tax=Niveibacterium sp. 24ML TaxID=2985512 RepID=UPI002272202B|nr:transketolase [Niveibacterium sp. 24ML]MCX9158358.1 transketolase [Niveibacterium sp. 24ML]